MRRILLVHSILLVMLIGFGLNQRRALAGPIASGNFPARPCGKCRPHPNPDALMPSQRVAVRSTNPDRSRLEPDPWPVRLTQAEPVPRFMVVRGTGPACLAALPENFPGPLALGCVLRI